MKYTIYTIESFNNGLGQVEVSELEDQSFEITQAEKKETKLKEKKKGIKKAYRIPLSKQIFALWIPEEEEKMKDVENIFNERIAETS